MSAARYEAARLTGSFAGVVARPGEVVPAKAIRALKPSVLRHLLEVGRLVLVVDGEPVAAGQAAAAVNVRAPRA